MTSRFRSILVAGLAGLTLTGCGDLFSNRTITYPSHERLARELKVNPGLLPAVDQALTNLYGNSPQHLKVPAGSPIPLGGLRLAHFVVRPEDGKRLRFKSQEGGYALYRRHCLHCHGVAGGGDGPTADFLFPRPRDYRKGMFKFTSTAYGRKPTRDDLRRTIRDGLPGSSMPAFDSLMTESEIEQIIDFVMFLSIRGETERFLLSEIALAAPADQKLSAEEAKSIAEESLPPETVEELSQNIFQQWKSADSEVVAPSIRRVATTGEDLQRSILRGRDTFLKSDCTGCHGLHAQGDGESFINPTIFQDIIFRNDDPERFDRVTILDLLSTLGPPDAQGQYALVPLAKLPQSVASTVDSGRDISVPEVLARLEEDGQVVRQARDGADAYRVAISSDRLAALRSERELWLKSYNEWGEPLRPANLNRGIYKGGRRPIDIFWRLATGINGAQMPAHTSFTPEETWDVVNFVLALPYQPELLRNATPPPITPTPEAPTSPVARR